VNIAGKTFVVTGSGAGIGREVTLELIRRGARVAGIDVNKDGLAETASLSGAGKDTFLPLATDITNRRSVMALPAKVAKVLGPVDGLINVAGIIQPFVRINELEFDAIDRVMSVNFFGPMNLIKAFLPGLLERPEAHIANVSSMGSYAPVPGQTLYGASKAAINLLSEGLRSELKGSNVGITVIYPGAIGTNIAENSGLHMEVPEDAPERKVVAPADAGQAIVSAVAESKKRIVIGQDAKTMWAMNRLSPDLAAGMIYQGMKDLLK
jgi:NAD(P)-dependent dehydrogenase (short-subunit alcohol dehydrogenase family)